MAEEGTVDERNLVDLLADGDERLKTRFSSPEIAQYLTSITSLNLPEVVQEPSKLASEASQLTRSLTSLCHNEYPTFLSLHRTSSVLSSTLSSFSNSLSSLISSLPALEASAKRFSSETQEVQAARRKARLVLEQHDALVDILDIPALIDTCVRNRFYQEAMDLAAHSRSLASRYPDIAVVQDVAAESSQAMRVMLAQLLALLREPAKLPALYKAISFVRKMGTLDEAELALAFLTSRLVNFDSVLDGIDREQTDHARFIRRYVDAWREGMHDIVTQYTTIFLDRVSSEGLGDELFYLLSTLTHHMLDTLLNVLSSSLPKIEDATYLPSLLTQLTHCSVSFARIGLDFRSLLPPLFEQAVKSKFVFSIEEATDKLVRTLSDAQKYSRPPSQWLVTPEAANAPPDDTTLPKATRIPPHTLSSYPPIAAYLNAIIGALNGLRLLAPTPLLSDLVYALDQSLARASSSFLVYAQFTADSKLNKRARNVSVDEDAPDQAQIVRIAGKLFANLMVPYARRSLSEGVYGESEPKKVDSQLDSSLMQWESWLAQSAT